MNGDTDYQSDTRTTHSDNNDDDGLRAVLPNSDEVTLNGVSEAQIDDMIQSLFNKFDNSNHKSLNDGTDLN